MKGTFFYKISFVFMKNEDVFRIAVLHKRDGSFSGTVLRVMATLFGHGNRTTTKRTVLPVTRSIMSGFHAIFGLFA